MFCWLPCINILAQQGLTLHKINAIKSNPVSASKALESAVLSTTSISHNALRAENEQIQPIWSNLVIYILVIWWSIGHTDQSSIQKNINKRYIF